MFIERSGFASSPMLAVLQDKTCHAKFVEFLTCLAAGESVGEDDEDFEVNFQDEDAPVSESGDESEDDTHAHTQAHRGRRDAQ